MMFLRAPTRPRVMGLAATAFLLLVAGIANRARADEDLSQAYDPHEGLAAYQSDTGGAVYHEQNSSPTGQCVWFCRAVRPDDLPSTSPTGLAYSMWDNATGANPPWHTGQTPKRGSVMVLSRDLPGSGGAGHVAIVVDVISDGEVIVWDSNFGSPALKVRKRRVNTSLAYLRGYIYAEGSDTPPILQGSDPSVVLQDLPPERWYRNNAHVGWRITGGSEPVTLEEIIDGRAVASYTRPPHIQGYVNLDQGGQGWHECWARVKNDFHPGWIDSPQRWHGGYDTSPPSLALAGGIPQQWYNAATSASVAASDPHSGIKTQSYRWNSGDGWTTGSQAPIPEGKHTLEARAEDDTWNGDSHDGNVAVVSLGEFWMDTAAPIANAPLFDITSPAGAAATTVTVTASGSDALSGIAKLEVLVDGVVIGSVAGATGAVPWNVASVPAGDHKVKVRATDNAGNQATSAEGTYVIERTSPVTTASLDGTAGPDGWRLSPVTVTLNATDASGVRSTHYTVDGGAEQTYAAPFVVTGDGVHAVAFWSYDATNPPPGNREATKTVEIKIDVTPPPSPIVLDEGAVTDDPSSLNGQWRGSDAGSGIAAYAYAVTDDPGLADAALAWSDAFPTQSTDCFFQARNLRLVTGPTYYLRVKLQDVAGLWSVSGQSDGIAVSGTALPNRLRYGVFGASGATEDSSPPIGTLGEFAVCTLEGNANGLPGDLLTQPDGLGFLWAGFWQTSLATWTESVVLAPSAVVGGETTLGTVHLAQPAPPDGAVVAISTDEPTAFVNLPSEVIVPEGETEVSFEVTTTPRTAGQVVRVFATYSGAKFADLLIRARYSMTYVIDRAGTVGEPVMLRAYLYGLPAREKLVGRSVAFAVEGTPVGSSVTNVDGRADLPWTVTPGATNRALSASFGGDMDYAPSSGSAALRSIVWSTKMAGFGRTRRITDTTELKARLVRSDNVPIYGKPISFSVDGTYVVTRQTDTQGYARWPVYVVPDGAGAGPRPIVAQWPGDDGYRPAQVSSTLTALKAIPYIWVLPKTIPQGDVANLYAYFRRLYDYQKQAAKDVVFRIDGTFVQSVTTDSSGVARCLYRSTEALGAHTIRCEFAGDAWVEAGYGEATLTVH